MNEILLNVLSLVVSAIVLPIISFIGAKIGSYINLKITNEKASKNLSEASNIVLNSVKTVFQTYVDELKKEGTFDKERQTYAFNKARIIALEQMSEEVKTFIETNYGSLDSWLQTEIESSILKIKNK